MDKIWHPFVRYIEDIPVFLDHNEEEYKEYIRFLSKFKPDEEVEMIVRKKSKPTTNCQNKYYWSVIVHVISEKTGHTPEEIHALLKWKFLKRRDEKGFEYVPSSMDLSTVDREKYHKDCRDWANVVLDLNIPLPNEAT